jgi:hypothetical protein
LNYSRIYETTVEVDDLMLKLFKNFSGLIKVIEDIATHGGVDSLVAQGELYESLDGKVLVARVNNYTKEIHRIIKRINTILTEKQIPDVGQTNQLVWLNNEEDSLVKSCMIRVFRNYKKDFDEIDRENMHIACTAYKESKDKLRVLIESLGEDYEKPTEITLPY